MCFDIDDNRRYKKPYPGKLVKIIAYKYLSTDYVHPEKNLFYSPFQHTVFKIGKVQHSSRKSRKLSPNEIKRGEVYKGFHFFRHKKEAWEDREPGDVVAVFEIARKDIVAYNKFEIVAVSAKLLGVSNKRKWVD